MKQRRQRARRQLALFGPSAKREAIGESWTPATRQELMRALSELLLAGLRGAAAPRQGERGEQQNRR
jgi:hypothetical protein